MDAFLLTFMRAGSPSSGNEVAWSSSDLGILESEYGVFPSLLPLDRGIYFPGEQILGPRAPSLDCWTLVLEQLPRR